MSKPKKPETNENNRIAPRFNVLTIPSKNVIANKDGTIEVISIFLNVVVLCVLPVNIVKYSRLYEPTHAMVNVKKNLDKIMIRD
jgi:hypothetical protein